jgi:hypothetical protein
MDLPSSLVQLKLLSHATSQAHLPPKNQIDLVQNDDCLTAACDGMEVAIGSPQIFNSWSSAYIVAKIEDHRAI